MSALVEQEAELKESPRTRLHCPCGEWLEGETEDELVELAFHHLEESHPNLKYTREEILFMAF